MVNSAEATPIPDNSKMDEDVKPDVEQIDAEKAKNIIQEKAKEYLIEQQKHVVVPSYSTWFNIDSIHSIEKKSFPDFFDQETGSKYKTPEFYQTVRNFMVNAYRINPVEYLTVTAIRRNLAGDVSSIIRIHKFLEKWGLINYQIDPRTKPSILGPQYTGHFQITLDTPTGLVPHLPEADIKNANDHHDDIKSDEKVHTDSSIPLNLEIRRNVYTKSQDLSKKLSLNETHFHCNVCGNDCTTVRYHNLKLKAFNSGTNTASILCASCYDQGLFPSNFYSSDFIKLQNEVSKDWSEQETLLLLEGVEIYGNYDSSNGIANNNTLGNNVSQWDKIAEHVGNSKTKEDCLIKFIQLPIEDRYLGKLIKSKNSSSSSSNSNETIIQKIVKEILSTENSSDKLSSNAIKKANFASQDQQELIAQIIELTLEKVSTKLSQLDILENKLIESQEQVSNEHKQLLYERWAQYEKINKYKQSNPELSSILDDLLVPVKVQEISNLKKKEDSDMKAAESISSVSNGGENLPISVTDPKKYQFWSS